MFGRKKKHNVHYRDFIWMTAAIKIQKLLSQIEEGKPIIIVSSFEKSLDELQSINPTLKKLEALSDFSINAGPWLINSKLILETTSFQQAITDEVQIIFTEHYPMPEKDSEIIAKTAAVFNNTKINFYISLEDPLMRLFNSDKLISMMKSLGLAEDDVIEHKMISKSIVNAQKKMAKKVSFEQHYDDEEAWYRMNYRG